MNACLGLNWLVPSMIGRKRKTNPAAGKNAPTTASFSFFTRVHYRPRSRLLSSSAERVRRRPDDHEDEWDITLNGCQGKPPAKLLGRFRPQIGNVHLNVHLNEVEVKEPQRVI